jgi:hypothetical protein
VDSVVFRVVVVSPYGDTEVPIVVVLLWSVWTPFGSIVVRVMLSVTLPGMDCTIGVVDWVDVVVDIVDCASAAPLISVRAVAVASQVFIITSSPVNRPAGEHRSRTCLKNGPHGDKFRVAPEDKPGSREIAAIPAS